MSMVSGRLEQSERFVDPIGHALQTALCLLGAGSAMAKPVVRALRLSITHMNSFARFSPTSAITGTPALPYSVVAA
jgi:hypothetical protein